MPVTFDAQEFAAALHQVKQEQSTSSANVASSAPLAVDEWQQSEEFKVRVIRARTKLKLMRDRSDALQDSLQRFRMQQISATRA